MFGLPLRPLRNARPTSYLRLSSPPFHRLPTCSMEPAAAKRARLSSPPKSTSNHPTSSQSFHSSSPPPTNSASSPPYSPVLNMDPSQGVEPVRKPVPFELEPSEQLLRWALLRARTHLTTHEDPSIADAAHRLEIYIAGGWVRDRLRGLKCHDVDIALSSMTGKQFADSLQAFIDNHSSEVREKAAALGLQFGEQAKALCTGFQSTKQNPGKSKNLETAVGRAFGLDLDLVNLRKEVYDDDSRTPVMDFGTEGEDAFRRDCSINALLVDVDTLEIEDWTGGLEDMDRGVIRTPLAPRQTFLDDPLRVLRLIRMCSKMGFELDVETREWMCRREIHEALAAKVSRERFGIEVFKMMRGGNARLAMALIHECGLWRNVFLGLESTLGQELQGTLPKAAPAPDEEDGGKNDAVKPWPPTWPQAYNFLNTLLGHDGPVGQLIRQDQDGIDGIDRYWLAVAYAPLAQLGKEHHRQAVADVSSSLKLAVAQTRLAQAFLQHNSSIRDAVATFAPSLPRSWTGVRIRQWGRAWRVELVCSLLAQAVYDAELAASVAADEARADHLRGYDTFVESVRREGLEDAHAARPVLDGKEIMELYGVLKGGSWLKATIDALVEWKFDNEEKGLEEAKEWLLAKREDLGVPEA